MNVNEAKDKMLAVGTAQRKSKVTIEAYTSHVLQYCRFVRRLPRNLQSEEKVRRYLESIAPRVSGSTQAGHLNALVWFYRHVLKKPLGDIGEWQYAQRPKRIPIWLNRQEVESLWPHMRNCTKLMAQLCFGSGLRRKECCSLRVKDLDFAAGILTVRAGKGSGGGKDRQTCLPRSLHLPLRTHLEKVRQLWEADRTAGRPGVYLPNSLAKKYPKYPSSWGWFWLFPAAKESRDPETGIVRRHHLEPDSLRKAVRRAAAAAGILKHATVHTLRHSFAVAMIEQGVGIADLAEMMGHKSIETTRIYLHCAKRFQGNHQSPLDTMGAEVIEFPIEQGKALTVEQGILR